VSDSRGPRRRKRDVKQPRKPRSAIRTYALPIAGAVAVAAVIWLSVVAARLFAPAGDVVTVPSLVGEDYAAAVAVAKDAQVGISIVARQSDFHAPKDQIIGQLPAAGEHVRVGRVIDVVVSDGQPTTKVPNVSNMSVRDAAVALENARLDVGTVTGHYDADVSEGTVLDQEPEALSEVPAGTKVDLTVASGRPIAYAPNFVGLTVQAALAAAKQAGVALEPPTVLAIAPSAPPKGVIASQDPAAGEQLRPHQTISLDVSGGPAPTQAPSPLATELATPAPATGAPETSPSASPSPLLPSPAASRGLRVSVALPASTAPTRIRVIVLDAAGQRTLYDQQTRGGFTLSFDITVTGAATLQTYVGDALVNSTPL
jgi:beta-lactam-binding protein with PASTA domain